MEEDKPDDKDEYDNCWRRDSSRFEFESVKVERDEVEGHGHSEQPSRHSPNSTYQNPTTPNRVHSHHINPRHDKIDTGNHQADGHGV